LLAASYRMAIGAVTFIITTLNVMTFSLMTLTITI